MHICFIYNEYPKETDNGGISTYQYNMAKALYEKDNKVTIIASSFKEESDYIENGIRVIRLKNNLMGTIDEQLNYRKKVLEKVQSINRQSKIDIIETPEMGAEALMCVKNKEIPVVVKLHTSYKIWSELNGQLLEENMHNQMISWEIEQLRKADSIISCSKLLKNIVKKDVKRKIDIIPNPVNLEHFFPLNIRQNSERILYCGSLEYRKGIFIFVKAIPLIIEKLGENIKFDIVGKDSFYNNNNNNNKMSELIFENLPQKYHKNVVLYGFVNKEILNRMYNEASVGVIPSLFDNLPYVAMEELLTELPIVISSNTGITSELKHNNSAIIFKNGNYKQLAKKVVKIYKNKKIANLIGKNGRKFILEKYSPEKIADVMINKYKKVIKNFK